jgi:hypothetical protein
VRNEIVFAAAAVMSASSSAPCWASQPCMCRGDRDALVRGRGGDQEPRLRLAGDHVQKQFSRMGSTKWSRGATRDAT